jgi:hypothetical protein
MENLTNQETQQSNLILTDNAVEISVEVREQITKKIEELRTQTGNKRIQAIVVAGDEYDEKPLYVGYFKRPNTMQFSLWMNQAQKDPVVANKTLAQNTFVSGDKELVDNEDLFLYGTMSKVAQLIESRNADLVKLSSAAK